MQSMTQAPFQKLAYTVAESTTPILARRRAAPAQRDESVADDRCKSADMMWFSECATDFNGTR